MIVRIGKLCELCNTVFKTDQEALEHFTVEHTNVALVKLKEFIAPYHYMDKDANCVESEQ